MKLSEFKDKKILIVGKGVEGKSAYEYLTKHFPDKTINIVDQKDGDDYLSNQDKYDIAIKSPGVKAESIKIPYTTATNIFFANARGKTIGITGTKGKSTTTSLIYKILEEAGKDVYMGGNIGLPMLSFLDDLNHTSWSVLELSSYQLSDIKYSPHIAIMLMIAPEHLDYHKDMEEYIDAKRNIFRFQTENDYAIVNQDYPASNESDIVGGAQVYKVSRENEVFDQGCFVRNGKMVIKMNGREEEVFNMEELALPGRHNWENACAAVAASLLAGATMRSIVLVLKSFKGLEHRIEFVGQVKGVRYFNDSLATIPEATIEAIEALGEDVQTLIAGGFDRGLDFSLLGEYLSDSNIKTLILFPDTGQKIWNALCSALPNENLRPEIIEVKTMHDALRKAYESTDYGKICLLSPASSSFGMFKNYKERGNEFKREVNALKN